MDYGVTRLRWCTRQAAGPRYRKERGFLSFRDSLGHRRGVADVRRREVETLLTARTKDGRVVRPDRVKEGYVLSAVKANV